VRSKTLSIIVVPQGTEEVIIREISWAGSDPYEHSSTLQLTATTTGSLTSITWSCSGGTLQNAGTLTPTWSLPATSGIYDITLTIENLLGRDQQTRSILVKNTQAENHHTPIIYYPFDNGDTRNAASDELHATNVNALPAADRNGTPDHAFQFSSSSQYIYVPNTSAFSYYFSSQIAIAFWLKPDFSSSEQYVISHGSWEERYKISIIPDHRIRWSLKTTQTVVDVDDPTPLQNGVWVHYLALYTGYSLELYRNGLYVAHKPLTGAIGSTTKDLTLARKDLATSDYTYRGLMDEVRFYNQELSLKDIQTLFTAEQATTISPTPTITPAIIYPNPSCGAFSIALPTGEAIISVAIYHITGQLVYLQKHCNVPRVVINTALMRGVYIVKVRGIKGEYVGKVVVGCGE
jgi:hypothetical protein